MEFVCVSIGHTHDIAAVLRDLTGTPKRIYIRLIWTCLYECCSKGWLGVENISDACRANATRFYRERNIHSLAETKTDVGMLCKEAAQSVDAFRVVVTVVIFFVLYETIIPDMCGTLLSRSWTEEMRVAELCTCGPSTRYSTWCEIVSNGLL